MDSRETPERHAADAALREYQANPPTYEEWIARWKAAAPRARRLVEWPEEKIKAVMAAHEKAVAKQKANARWK